MLNLEYARLVDDDRRRVAEARMNRERLLHPEPAPSQARDEVPASPRADGTRIDCRTAPRPAR
jgi:hypothetical protein